jgi:hypothetical protein
MSMITEVSDISRSLWCRRDSCASEETVPFSYRGFSASQSRPTIPAEGGPRPVSKKKMLRLALSAWTANSSLLVLGWLRQRCSSRPKGLREVLFA